MGIRVVFVDGPADGVHRFYPDLDIALAQLYLFDYQRGRPLAAYRRLDEAPAADGSWRYQWVEGTIPGWDPANC